jgi:hypothetical protein
MPLPQTQGRSDGAAIDDFRRLHRNAPAPRSRLKDGAQLFSRGRRDKASAARRFTLALLLSEHSRERSGHPVELEHVGEHGQIAVVVARARAQPAVQLQLDRTASLSGLVLHGRESVTIGDLEHP